jgi:hypothetical protein
MPRQASPKVWLESLQRASSPTPAEVLKICRYLCDRTVYRNVLLRYAPAAGLSQIIRIESTTWRLFRSEH